MAKYNECKNCGAHLDHGEKCDCLKLEAIRKERYERMVLEYEERKKEEFLCEKG